MSEWREMSLGEVLTLQRGHDLPSQKRMQGNVPIISSSGVTDFHSEAAAVGPGVVTGRYGTIGEVFYSQSDYWPLNTTLYVKDFKGNFPKYIYYLLKTVDFHQFNDKSSVPGVNRNHAHLARVRIPGSDTQRQIAAILSAFDDKIEINRQTNRTLEAMARALFQSWFVDFDPVRAKMRGEQPKGMDAETAALFPDEMDVVDGREAPRGWEWVALDSQLQILGGGTPKTSNPDFWDGVIPWYSVVDVPNDGDVWVLDTSKHITESGLANSPTRLLPVGTTIISARGTVGKLALTACPMSMNQSCYGLFPRDAASIYFTYLSTQHAIHELKGKVHGAVFDTITKETLSTVTSISPPSGMVAAFEEASGNLMSQILGNLRETAQLSSLRDALLPRLLSGEVDVGEWEKKI